MVNLFRSLLMLIGVIQIGSAVAFFLQWPVVTNLWPFVGTTPLTFIFVSSILAAAGASTLWASASANDGALAGIGLDYIAILAPPAIFTFRPGTGPTNSTMVLFGVLCAAGALFGLVLFLWSVRIPVNNALPTPGLVRVSFGVFVLALVIVSVRLIWQVPNAIPWRITPELSVVMGWMFMGAALYFAYGLLRPSWMRSQ